MKKYLLLCFSLMSIMLNAQKADEIKELYWGADDPYKNVTSVPDKYKNESAVIIYKNENYDFHKFMAKVTYTSSVRKRIKLLDQAAVKRFSEFSFESNFISNRGAYYYNRKSSEVTVGVKIIKPDGKEIEIDVNKEAVKQDGSTKVAISNLEVGDIIDYYFHTVEPFVSVLEYGFAPVETTLGENYPVLNLKILFKTENDFFVNFNSYNGAPPLKKVETKKGNDRIYELVAQDIEKNDFPRWFLPLVEMPCYKFQVFFARSGKFEKRADAFLPEKENIIKSVVTKEDIFNYYDSKFSPNGELKPVNEFLKGKTFASEEEKIMAVYYFIRHEYFTRYIEAFVVDEAKIISYPYNLYDYPIFFRTEENFINYFMEYLKKSKIDYEIIIATGRENGPIKDILIQQNAKVLLKINTPNPIYLSSLDSFSVPNQFDSEIEGTQAYALKVAKSKKVTDIEEITLPHSTNTDNHSATVTNVKLTDNFSSLQIEKQTDLYGHNKEFEQKSKINFYDYVNEDYEKYGTTPLLDLVKNKKRKEQYKKEYDALLTKLKDKQTEKFKEELEKEFETKIEDLSFKIINTGRFGKDTPLSFSESFKIKDNFIKKAGSNYIIELGKLIDSQVDIKDKEKDRTNNIYMSFPRAFDYTINLTIPDGYTVSGIDKFNKNVSNATGSFISTAEIKENVLTIHATKKYNHNYEPVTNWSQMIDFLDTAYQFTQEKILLKKL
ncbi:DUF3857 domain-containing protein [Flavobacterium sp. NRK F10]|uniref:DUF3857 domain-containing protein n=1 Tax=Flavobacterium sediminis TaxID=2201181 RepID=A0A2U8QXP2_9FLAO|nr:MULTISPECIES: DUF3857 domain-containing protein [Flavobacterium]AWM14923.1 hypothetical protein DI487_14405 [Flavobacterium sediminis]MCO6176183.1 DUF3857 domain-containing protein [Flavobacterium sp. NRK F10]